MRHKDGYIIIGEQAYGTKEAHNIALKDVNYFQEHDKHLPSLPYPATPDLKKEYYPDVTKQVYHKLDEIAAIIMSAEPVMRFALIEQSFPNDQSWDLQVNHGLPGQVLDLNLSNTDVLKDDSEKVKARDQYAVFKGEIRQAGYISNFAFGYACAAANLKDYEMIAIAEGVSLLSNHKLDNLDDIRAMREGWLNWHSRYKLK